MLQSLHVKNLALIDEIEIEFQPGLNILTGETGAGKSIIIGSVNLALGGRYNADILRQGAASGFVELSFYVSNERQIKRLQSLEIFPEEGMVILSRKFMEGRSVSRINGETAAISRLKAAAEILIDIHGQHEHQSLLYKKNHLAILDAFARDAIGDQKEKVSQVYQRYKGCQKKLQESVLNEKDRKKEVSLLSFEIEEIREAGLVEKEDVQLEDAYRKMINGKKISEAVGEAYACTSDTPGQNASDCLSRAIRSIQDIAGLDEQAQGLYEQLTEVDGLLNDFNRELSDYGKSLEFSAEDFYAAENRLNIINHLKSKYGNTIEEILEYCRCQEERLEELSDYDLYLEKINREYQEAEKKLSDYCSELSRIRKENAAVLSELIRQGLIDLNFAEVKFDIQVRELDEFTANGQDEVEFMVSLNPGEAVRSLANVASGGELSRIMLAIKTVLAGKDDKETLIFDEIDVGISGRTAQKVSEKMSVLAKKHQVICITHLAQIAAMADGHYLIEKIVSGNKTKTDITLLSEAASVNELARILGGAQITETVLKSAGGMKKLAQSRK